MSSSTDLMTQSPLGEARPTGAGNGQPQTLVQITRTPQAAWVPSRYNARATDDSGRLIVWNTLSGSITVFGEGQAPQVERYLTQKGYTGPLDRLGEYLSDRGIIVRKGVDEARRLQLAFGRQHYADDALHLILLASEDCNFRCVYCYEDFQRGTMAPAVRQGVRRLVEKRLQNLKQLRVSWFGGEPLYGFEAIEELAPYFARASREYGLDYHAHMTTNAYLLTPDVVDKLFTWEIRDFQITVDGTAEQHDRKRVGRDGSGTFDTIFANLKAMRDRDDEFEVVLRVNYDRENHPHMDAYFDLLEREFAGDARFRLALHAVGKWGGPNDAGLDTCGLDESREVRRRLKAAAADRGLNVDGGGVKSLTHLGSHVCYAARPYSFVIGADGKLMKCTIVLDKEDHNVVGRITPEGELELDDQRLAQWVEPAFLNDSGCGRCHMSPTCQGMHCPLIRIRTQQRPCPETKRELRTALLETLDKYAGAARRVTV